MLRTIIIILSLTAFLPFAAAEEKISSASLDFPVIPDVSALFKLDSFFGENSPGVLVYRPLRRTMGLYRYNNGKLFHTRRAAPWTEVVQAATVTVETEKKIAVAYRYFPGTAKEKLRIVLYDSDLDFPQVIFEQSSYQGTVTFLREIEGKLLLSFVHSESYSKGGYLEYLPESGSWKFNRLFAGQEQRSIDAVEDKVAIGSLMSTEGEQKSQIQIGWAGKWYDGPSDRGVSAIRILQLDKDPEPELIIGDGLPDPQRKRGKPQLARLNWDPEKKTFRRDLLKELKTGDNFAEKIEDVTIGGKHRLLVKGKTYLTLYAVEKDGPSETLYRKRSENAKGNIDYLLLESSKDGLVFALLDGDLLELRSYGSTAFAAKQKQEATVVAVDPGGVTLVHYLSDEVATKGEVGELSALRETGANLDLSKTDVTDSDLAQLQGSSFSNLRFLNLRETGITDEGLQYLKGLPLRVLILESTEVTGSGFKHLMSLPLKKLVLEDTQVDNQGLRNIQGIALDELDLTGTNVTDEGMEYLRGSDIKVLNLYSTGITDAGLEFVLELPLKKLYLTGTQVTEEEVERVKYKYPELSVIY